MRIKIFVIHVSTQHERRLHIERQLARCGLPFECEFIDKGDMKDLTDDVLDRYYINRPDCQMHVVAPATSCSYKHLLACHAIVDEKLDGALVLEDDIFLHSDFKEVFLKSIDEWQRRMPNEPILISYEDSALLFVKGSEKKKGQILYDGNHDRYTGCIFVSNKCATDLLDDILTNKTHLPIDGYHNNLLHRGVIRYLWCSPEIATQGSHNGTFGTMISKKRDHLLQLKWFFKKNYRKLLYSLR